MKHTLKTIIVAGILLGLGIAEGQSVKRHPGQHLNYGVSLADGDIDKIVAVSLTFRSQTAAPPNQPNAQSAFGAQCKKSPDPKVWECDATIPPVSNGDYKLTELNVGTSVYTKTYTDGFSVPLVPIENPDTFNAPAHVTVTERP